MVNSNDKNSTSKTIPNDPGFLTAIRDNAIILAVFALSATGLMTVTYWLTKDKIAQQVEQSLIKQLSQLVPPSEYSNNVYQDCTIIRNSISDPASLDDESVEKYYRMRNGKNNYAVLITRVAADGYSGKITLAVAISQSGKILGVNILNHQETPGLGDKIERGKSHWLDQFVGLSLNNLSEQDWKVKKDGGQFDALTGATITPRAVIKAVYNSLSFYSNNRQSLFNQPSNCFKNKLNEKNNG